MALEKDGFKTGERRFVTILFSDLRGFSALSESMDPEEIDSLMTSLFNSFESIIKSYGGIVEKYIGDALVAVFGVPRIHEDDPSRAVHAALDFQSSVEQRNIRLKEKKLALLFRTGINTGLVTTGKRGNFEVVTGHTMNIAARLQEQAEPGGILVSENTMEKCGNDFSFSDGQLFPLKGTEEHIRAYSVLGRNNTRETYGTPFVNRQDTINTLLRGYIKFDNSLIDGFILTGEPGIGKSRILFQFLEKIRQFPGTTPVILYAKANRYRPEPFSLVTDLLYDYFRYQEETNKISMADELSQGLELEESIREQFLELLEKKTLKTDASGVFLVLYTVLSAIIKKNREIPYSVILVVDNIQNLDPQSLDFFRFYLKSSETRPFFLFSGRAENQQVFNVFRDITILEIPPLSPADSAALLKLLWPDPLEPQKERKILELSGGIPLFLEEYVKYAKENREISNLPDTIQNIFLSGLENLDKEHQELLKKLSIFIHSFTKEDVNYIEEKTGEDSSYTGQKLAVLVKIGFLSRDKNFYSFKNDLFKRALYNSLLNYNKKILHGLVAERIKEQENPNLFRLIHHLIRADKFSEAGETMVKDPGYIQKLEYIPYLDTLINEMEKVNQDLLFRYLFIKSAILFNNGKRDESEDILKQMIHQTILKGKPGLLAGVYHLLCGFFIVSCNFEKTEFCGKKAVFYYNKAKGDLPAIQNVYKMTARAALLKNSLDKNQKYLDGMQYTTDSGYDMKTSARLDRLYYLGQYREAISLAEKILTNPVKDKADLWVSFVYQLGFIFWKIRDFGKAKGLLKLLLPIKHLSVTTLAEIYALLSECCFNTDEKEKAPDYMRQSEFYFYQIQNDFEIVEASKTIAAVLSIIGDKNRAEEMVKRGLELGLRHTLFHGTFSLLVLMTELSIEKENIEEARFFHQEAGFFADLNYLLDRQDRILFHYFSYKLSPEASEQGKSCLEKAISLLEEEEQALGAEELYKNLLSTRSFGRIPLESEFNK